MNMTTVAIPVGERKLDVSIPNLIGVVEPPYSVGVPDTRAEIVRAIMHPIGSPPLREIARGKSSAAIVINDITRPYAGGIMVEEIARELNAAGLNDSDIFLVVAYGNHRANTVDELRSAYGSKAIDRFRIVHHFANDPNTLETLGYTQGGVKVQVNREFAHAGVKITTGCIAPHQLAGFSGGRKSILPGISGIDSLKAHHSLPIRPVVSSMGWLEGNRFHEEALAAAQIAGVDFIVNSVENSDRKIVECVAGSLTDAYYKGVETCRRVWTVEIPCRPDVVVVSPGGYPRDFDLHQSQKAIGCAEMICRPGGEIIICAEMRDGVGKPGVMLKNSKRPEDVVERFLTLGYQPDATSKAYMFARAVINFRVAIAGSIIPVQEVESMFMHGFATIDEAIIDALTHYGPSARFLAIPHASEIIPVIKAE